MNPLRDRQDEADLFEDEVRRIARQLWPDAAHGGAQVRNGRERDGVFETEECVHLVEATTSRTKKKAVDDAAKLVKLAKDMQSRRRYKAVKCWFITRDEPTADQRGVCDKHKPLISALSFAQFQSRLIDARSYLSARDNHEFGSVRDPDTADREPSVEYIPLDVLELGERRTLRPDELAKGLLKGDSLVLLGDYGAGKSMTLREVYRALKVIHLRNRSSRFPVYLNLREHWGQTEPAEALERHARHIGFGTPSHLVRAWRSGYVVIILDGFDELASTGMQGLWKQLARVRRQSMTLVRRFVDQNPTDAGIAIAGRGHFFHSEKELKDHLGLGNRFKALSLAEFSTDQVRDYLEKAGLEGSIPDWLPARPLFVGYLASRGFLTGTIDGESAQLAAIEEGEGWSRLLELVCTREARIESGIDGETVRQILERLATVARSSGSGLGPLTPGDLFTAFREVCGYSPEEPHLTILQRLPGLGIDRIGDENRSFLDEDFADACRAGDVARFVERPYDFDVPTLYQVEHCLGETGVRVGAQIVSAAGTTPKALNVALRYARDRIGASYLTADLARVALESRVSIEQDTAVTDVLIPEVVLDDGALDNSHIRFVECYIGRLVIDVQLPVENLPRFHRCYIGELDGVTSRSQLPEGLLDSECEVDQIATTTATTSSLLALPLPLGARVLLTVLKKLFAQKGAGRKENALLRGLDQDERRLVPEILRILQKEGFALASRRRGVTIWVPDRKQICRIGHILASPETTDDELVEKCRDL